jgi:GTP-binding protein EngB required for normal cell division
MIEDVRDTFESLDEALTLVRNVATERGDCLISVEAAKAAEALTQGRFNVAFLGQFKRGKSTLINAILGRNVLPTDIVPLTTAITIVQHGQKDRCTVLYGDGRREEVDPKLIGSFVSEEGNPGNRKGVEEVVLELPVPVLESGMRLVDTPGVGSIFELNTKVTSAYLPRIDVAVIVLGGDPPISGEEIALVRAIATKVEHLFFVLNKIDQVSNQVLDRAEEFTHRVLAQELGKDPGPLLRVYALGAFEGKLDSGVTALVEKLAALSDVSGADLALASASHAADHLASRLIQQLDIERAALLAPLADLSRRVEAFQASMKDIDDLALAALTRAKSEMTCDWKAWESGQQRAVAREREQMLGDIRIACMQVHGSKRGIRLAAIQLAREEVREFLEQQRSIASHWLTESHAAQAERVAGETNRLVARVAEAVASAFGIPVMPLEISPARVDMAGIGFDLFETTMALDVNDWLVPLVDVFLPGKIVVKRAVRRADSAIADWFMRNFNHLDEHMLDWINEGTKQLHDSMRARLDAMHKEILEAVDLGRLQQAKGKAAIAERLDAIERQRLKLEPLTRR